MSRLTLFFFICMTLTGVMMAQEAEDKPFRKPLVKGVTLKLSAVNETHKLGQAISVSLELANNSEKSIRFDLQGIRESGIEVTDGSGERIACMAREVQTTADWLTLKAGQKKTIQSFNIYNTHAIVESGTYSLVFTGDRGAFGEAGIPESNTIQIDLAEGKISKHRELLKEVAGCLGGAWSLEAGRADANYAISPRFFFKADTVGFHNRLKTGWYSVIVIRPHDQLRAGESIRPDMVRFLGKHATLGAIHAYAPGYHKLLPQAKKNVDELIANLEKAVRDGS